MMAFRTASTRLKAMLLGTVCCLVWSANPPISQARTAPPAQPSVEVNFDALRGLEPPKVATPAAPSYPQVPGRKAVNGAAVPPEQRKLPSEQPNFDRPAPTALPKPLPVRRVVPVAQPPAASTFAPSEPPFSTQPYQPKAPAAKAKKKTLRKPKVEDVPATAPAEPAVAPAVPDFVPPAVEPPAAKVKQPVAKAILPDAPSPVPVVTMPGAPPALPDAMPPKAPASANVPPLPPLNAAGKDAMPPALPAPAPPAAPKGPDVNQLDFSKMPSGAKPPEPPMVFVPSKTPAPLPPSVEKRVDSMMTKEPAKQGIISDKTHIDDPTVKVKADLKAKERDKAEAAADAKAKAPAPLELPPALPDAAPAQKAPAKGAAPEKLPPAELPAASRPSVPEVSLPKGDAVPPPPPMPDMKPAPASNSVSLPAPPGLPAEVKKEASPSPAATAPAPLPLPSPPASDKPPAIAPLPAPVIDPVKPAAPKEEVKKEETKKDEAKKDPALPAPPPVSLPPVTPVDTSTAAMTKTLAFDKDKSDLPDSAKIELAEMAEKIKQSSANVRIVAYASGTAEQASVAKRISLSRALAIRAFLIGKGVNQLNINVQALGNQVPSGNPDRADVIVK